MPHSLHPYVAVMRLLVRHLTRGKKSTYSPSTGRVNEGVLTSVQSLTVTHFIMNKNRRKILDMIVVPDLN